MNNSRKIKLLNNKKTKNYSDTKISFESVVCKIDLNHPIGFRISYNSYENITVLIPLYRLEK